MLSSRIALSLVVIAAGVEIGAAFAPPATGIALRTAPALRMAKINGDQDQEAEKVVDNVKLAAGDKGVYCRCWKSKTFPKCDGAHNKHNEEEGDNVGPLIIAVDK
mmetsp:Transcript_27406/g.66087  ORF Transcript_27406/g.66087 Transcript_27406/m.66087 type:complete len:105 (+) Transcript_27406:42-356(+)